MKLSFLKLIVCFLVSVICPSLHAENTNKLGQKSCLQTEATEYCEPFFFRKAEQLSVYGTVDYQFAMDQVKKFGFKPIPIQNQGQNSDPNKAVMTISLLTYGETSFGPYQEFILMLPVQQATENVRFDKIIDFIFASKDLNSGLTSPRFGNYMIRLILDGNPAAAELGLQAGVKLYGYPKEIGKIQAAISGSVRKNYAVQNISRELKITTDLNYEALIDTPEFPIKGDSYAITTGNGYVQWEKMAVEGKTRMPLLIKDGTFLIKATGQEEAFFAKLNFLPEYSTFVYDLNLILTAGANAMSTLVSLAENQPDARDILIVTDRSVFAENLRAILRTQ